MTTPLKTHVLLADDHAVVRSGLRTVLDAEPDIEVVAEAADGAEAVQRRSPRASTWRSSMCPCPA